MISLAVVFGVILIFWLCKKCLPRRRGKKGKKGLNVDADDDKVIKFASALTKQLVSSKYWRLMCTSMTTPQ